MSSNATAQSTRFNKSFTQQEAIPEDAIAAAVEVMRSGRLHRYNVASDEDTSQTAALESAFARYQGVDHCLACASGGYAMQLAMRAAGVKQGEAVLTNAFTLSPVPGAVFAVGGVPILVETTENLVIDLDDLKSRASASNARYLLLSHMRGHIADMDAVVALCDQMQLVLIEDCAHTMGATFDGVKSGTHGTLGCFSTQTYKHINSGEGGFVTTDDPEIAARLILMSGSYMLYARHRAAPDSSVLDEQRLSMPNLSGRMDELRASILIPQLDLLGDNVARWNEREAVLAAAIADLEHVHLPTVHPLASEVRSSFQFRVPGYDTDHMRDLISRCAARGVELKWFGDDIPKGYTSRYEHWEYIDSPTLSRTNHVLSTLLDIRVPLSFSVEDCRLLGSMLREELTVTRT
jgi:dTDP-4-amino-4,6-dideoxygalactose transaminase